MFERFSDGARRVVVVAQEEARRLGHNHIGTEHMLLGILREGENVATDTLRSLGIDLDVLRREVEARIGRGEVKGAAHIPFTPGAKKTLEEALRESVQLKSGYIGTEHILLGLIREGEGIAAQVLNEHGVTLERAQQEVARLEPKGESRLSEASLWVRPAGAGAGAALEEIAGQLRIINRRLAAIEAKLGIDDTPAASA
jgi:ATP-dependent Clp protease ATP-binding subunit ClpC